MKELLPFALAPAIFICGVNMPFTIDSDNLPSNVKKMPAKKKKAWVSTFNSVYNSCIDDGGSASACETKAFKVANGNAKKQEIENNMGVRSVFHQMFEGWMESLGIADDTDRFELTPEQRKILMVERFLKQRSTSIGRVFEQLREALWARNDEEGTWSYPMDVYVNDGGTGLFAIVTQGGKLFQVPLTVSKDTVSLGEWTQVKEEFTPVEQSFRVRRQKDGKYRWVCIAGTTVLNRVGEIDSSSLFDSFIERAEKTGEYPRLDFYHKGLEDAEKWEFGTADFLAREGTCYIASGLFDEEHPLAIATIQACEKEPGVWGNSIEFYATVEPEIILADPEIKIPVYQQGKNTRISVVLEEDAAGLFTRIGVLTEGATRTMDAKTKEKLGKLFGADTEGLESFIGQFEENVDGVNRTVKDNNLIHRAKDGKATEAEDAAVEEENDNEEEEIVIDDETVAAIAQQVTQSAEFKAMASSIEEMKKLVGEMVVEREKDGVKITSLTEEIVRLSKDEVEKKSEFLQDLPTRKRTHITHRPRAVHNEDAQETDMGTRAKQTLNGIPAAGRY